MQKGLIRRKTKETTKQRTNQPQNLLPPIFTLQLLKPCHRNKMFKKFYTLIHFTY